MGCKLDERGQRLFAANEVQAAGHGALKIVSEITGLARSTINRGEDDLEASPLPEGRVRRKGGGPKPLSERDPTLVSDLQVASGTSLPFARRTKFVSCWGHFCRAVGASRPVGRDPTRTISCSPLVSPCKQPPCGLGSTADVAAIAMD